MVLMRVSMLLFLDFDGVLHPYPCADSELFCWMDNFEQVLQSFPEIEIVISSSWREQRSLEALKQLFPTSLRSQIIGATPVLPVSDEDWLSPHREQEILQWLRQHQREDEAWLAIDDTLELFEHCTDRVLLCDSYVGLDDESSQQLVKYLQQLS